MLVSLTLFRLLLSDLVTSSSSLLNLLYTRHRASAVHCLASLHSITLTLSLLPIFSRFIISVCFYIFYSCHACHMFLLFQFQLSFIYFSSFLYVFIMFGFSFCSGTMFLLLFQHQFQFLCFSIILVSVSSLCLFVGFSHGILL